MKASLFRSPASSLTLFGSFIFLLYTSSFSPKGVIDHFKVGDVVYSILKEEDFIKLHGSGWRSLSPIQPLTGTDLNKLFGVSALPDGRGTFVRGMNIGGGYDPENNRAVGSYQPDDFKSHSHIMGRLWEGNGNPNRGNELTQSTGSSLKSGPTELTGGAETRPRNITLYIYIKVSEDVN